MPTKAPAEKAPAEVDTFEPEVLLEILSAVKHGDYTARMPVHWTGMGGKIADELNDIIGANEALGTELERVSRVVGKEGKLSERVSFKGTDQVWGGCIESVNSLIEDLVQPSNEMQRVIGAVADGDLSKKVSADVQGEMLVLKNTINDMVDQLNGFISEVTRVAREVGTEGKLGQKAAVTIEVGGVWKDLTDNVNLMAQNLTGQVRDIAEVTTAVANGDLSKKISADVKGEFLELKNTVNAMVDQLNRFASEVTRVAREVGFEGKLGGQAQSAEVAGVWKDLTDNVNQLAANLTDQVRAISDVATAVTEGDLTRQVGVEASGEVAVLKDTLNEMIRNLRETTRVNTEQDWLKTNLERFTRMLQGQRDLATVSNMVLSELAPLVSAQHGVFYALTDLEDGGDPVLQFQAGYGFQERKHLGKFFRLGEGLVGQCAVEKERILLTEVPSDYIKINSALGESKPLNIIVLPILFEGSVLAVIELASFAPFSPAHQSLLDQLTESIGLVLNTVAANSVTEQLLEQAQSQAQELQSRQEQLHQSNEDLADQATQLADKNSEVESKFEEVEAAKRLVEEKAEQLATSSKYKSEFFANMSHELRTPLNSLLVLAEQLEDNPDGNLSKQQVGYAHVIRESGTDLLKLLNDVLDLAKVESNTVQLDFSEVSLEDLRESMHQSFDPVAASQGLAYTVRMDAALPETIHTDPHRLRQVLKNLLANAFKFTEAGEVTLSLDRSVGGWSPNQERLSNADSVLAITVADTGIGIKQDLQSVIFEAFAQGDGTNTRQYEGTGLGLSISTNLVDLLGGEITLTSEPGAGSAFTVYLPLETASAVPPSPSPAGPENGSASQGVAAPTNGAVKVAASADQPEASTATAVAPVEEQVTPKDSAAETEAQKAGVATAKRKFTARSGGETVLVVDDDFRNIFALTALLERGHLNVIAAESGADALAILDEDNDIDMVLMDIMMPEMDGYQTMGEIRTRPQYADLPIIAVTGKVIGGERERCLAAGASDYIPKPVDTAELLGALEEWFPAGPAPTNGAVKAAAPADQPEASTATAVAPVEEQVTPKDSAAETEAPKAGVATAKRKFTARSGGETVLVVDDDFRNIFALTALLERGHLNVIAAESGADALAILDEDNDIDMILMDIMMPEMDGYQTMGEIRTRPQYADLPIIAVTGKVIGGERERCLAAGASDYIPKPVDTAELLGALEQWFPAGPAGKAAKPADS